MVALFTALFTLLAALASIKLDDRTWDLVPAIVGGVLGALAGGIPAYALARHASKENASTEREKRLSSDIALLYSTAQKLIEITNGLFTICLEFNEQIGRAVLEGRRDMRLHGILRPVVGIGDEDVRFSTDEIAAFFRFDQDDFANELLLLSRRYAANISSLKEYSSRRDTFVNSLTPISFSDGIGSIELKGPEAIRASAMAYALDEMAETLLQRFNDDRRKATLLSSQFGGVAKSMYPGSKVPEMAFGH